MPRLGLLVTAVLLVTTSQVGPARADFTPATVIGGGDQFQATDIAADAGGNSISIYSERPGNAGPRLIKARRVSVGGAVGPVLDLAPGESGHQGAVEVTPAGRAFAVWRAEEGVGGPDGVKGRWIEPDGSLGPILTFVTGVEGVTDVEQIAVTIDVSGNAIVGWNGFTGTDNFTIRRASPAGALSEAVPNISDGSAQSPIRLEALPDGSTLATWRGSGLEKNVISPTLEVGIDEVVSPSAQTYHLATDAAGNSLAAWRQTAGETYAVVGRMLDPSGSIVGADVSIADPQEGFLNLSGIAADSVGDFIVAWNRQNEDGVAITYARTLSTAATFGGPANPFSIPPEVARGAVPALFDDGSGALVWEADGLAKARAFGPAAVPGGAVQILNGIGETTFAAAAPAAGAAAFLLKYNDSGSTGAALVRRFLTPPSCLSSSASALPGIPAVLPLPCEGPAIRHVRIVSGPSHGALGAYDPATGTIPYTATGGFDGADSFTYEAFNDGGISGPATVSIAVADVVRPQITSLRLIRPKGKAAKRRRPPYRFALRISERAEVRVAVQRRLPGVRRGKRCAKPRTRAQLRRGKRCDRFAGVGAVRSKGLSERVTLRASGKISRQLRRGGRFRLVAVATDKVGLKSRARRVPVRTR